jgi:methylenetetrahydrofolate reductase (NADPH)
VLATARHVDDRRARHPSFSEPFVGTSKEWCMQIADARAHDTRPTFSFELYPPRTPEAAAALPAAIDELVATGPEFISVTYGASGSTRGVSIDVLRRLLASPVQPMAHITCVGTTFADASLLIREFLDAGVTSFLALRGDPPAGVAEEDVELGDLGSAAELVQLIHNVQTEREPFTRHPVPGFPNARRLGPGPHVTIAVAAFPNGHPRSRTVDQDIDALLAKEAAGANLAITQLFFEADDYLSFVERARAAGVTMRILPGLMPATSPARLRRIVELADERMPTSLLRALETADDPVAVGIAHAAGLGRALLAGGAPGLHLYTFNRPEAPLAVLRDVGLLDTTRIPV